jgi:hypothetical protein
MAAFVFLPFLVGGLAHQARAAPDVTCALCGSNSIRRRRAWRPLSSVCRLVQCDCQYEFRNRPRVASTPRGEPQAIGSAACPERVQAFSAAPGDHRVSASPAGARLATHTRGLRPRFGAELRCCNSVLHQ